MSYLHICYIQHYSNDIILVLHTLLTAGILDSKEINITVPPKGGNAGEKATGVIDLSNTSQMASEVFKFANAVKGMPLCVTLLFCALYCTLLHSTGLHYTLLFYTRIKSNRIFSHFISYTLTYSTVLNSILYYLSHTDAPPSILTRHLVGGGRKNERKKMTVAEARPILEESELEK